MCLLPNHIIVQPRVFKLKTYEFLTIKIFAKFLDLDEFRENVRFI